MRVFIIRPFGTKEGVNFDLVEEKLIQPALKRLRALGNDVDGGTTGKISKAGNIQEDMFRLIAVSDLVIADVTIHNANSFYELGIRHALCPGRTHMIRANDGAKDFPFDLQANRYFTYDLKEPEKSVDDFVAALQGSLAQERDSPIFNLLTDLKPHGRGQLVKVPADFSEAVTRARNGNRRGVLRLLAHECTAYEWDQEGLAAVGDAQFKLRAYLGARATFELLRKASPQHYHANWRLGTIYQRLALAAAPQDKSDLTTNSEHAIERALSAAATVAQQAEQHALLGSNAKNRWMDDYRVGPMETRQQRALESPYLEKMLEHYMRAAACDLSAHYPAINVLAFLRVQTLLARRFKDVWEGMQDDKAEQMLKERESLIERIAASLRLILQLDDTLQPYQPPPDPWAKSSIADFTLLTTPEKVPQISKRYRDANADADRFSLEANRRNLDIFKELGLLEPGVSAALAVIDAEMQTKAPPEPPLKRVLLFTGHRIDGSNRTGPTARFPATAKAEQTARKLIYDAVAQEVGGDASETLAIAGGACGGDILFHEVCAELKIRTELYLAVEKSIYQRESVADAGAGWVTRFQDLHDKLGVQTLQDDTTFPNWLTGKPAHYLWERNNLWTLFSALGTGAKKQTLIALFNPEREADGPGGTKDLMRIANTYGLKTVPIDARPLLD
jgi:hypothetical protein